MKKNLAFNNKILIKYILLSLVWLPLNNQAQTIKRQCISSYGTSSLTEKTVIKQTVGQPYYTTSISFNNISILPGFQQPNVLKFKNKQTEDSKNLDLSIYPNPARYTATIHSEEIIEMSSIRVIDMYGKTILSDNVKQLQSYTINCNTWKNGIYFITVDDSNKRQTTLKLIISK